MKVISNGESKNLYASFIQNTYGLNVHVVPNITRDQAIYDGGVIYCFDGNVKDVLNITSLKKSNLNSYIHSGKMINNILVLYDYDYLKSMNKEKVILNIIKFAYEIIDININKLKKLDVKIY